MADSNKGMNAENSKRNPSEDEKLLKELAKCILEVLRGESQNDKEPFENYAHALRLRLYANEQAFQERFVKGYEVLLSTLTKNKKE